MSGRTRGPAPARKQTETMSWGKHTSRLKQSSSVLTGTILKPGAQGAHGGGWQLAAGGVRNTKDRDTLALEVRAGTLAMGRTSWDTAGLSSNNSNRVKVARTSVEKGRNPSVLRQRLRFGHCCSVSQKRHSRPPVKAAREHKPGNTSSQCAHPQPASQGTRRLYPNRLA